VVTVPCANAGTAAITRKSAIKTKSLVRIFSLSYQNSAKEVVPVMRWGAGGSHLCGSKSRY
jgi:hypothetical protein